MVTAENPLNSFKSWPHRIYYINCSIFVVCYHGSQVYTMLLHKKCHNVPIFVMCNTSIISYNAIYFLYHDYDIIILIPWYYRDMFFIGNGTYKSEAKITFCNRDVHKLQGIVLFWYFSVFIYFQVLKSHLVVTNYHAFVRSIYREKSAIQRIGDIQNILLNITKN